jgi:hypothetical protein
MKSLLNDLVKTGRRMERQRIESYLAILVGCALIALMGNYFKATVFKHHLDTAFLLEIAETARVKGEPVSTLLVAAVDGSRTWSLLASDVCASELEPTASEYNVLDNHAYYGIYAIAQLTRFAQAETILSYLHGFSFVAILIAAYWFLRHNGISVSAALVFCLAVSLHPAWSFAATGNYYMDRFYMPFALLYLMGMHWLLSGPAIVYRRWVWAGLLVAGFVAAMMTERAAIMMGFASFAILFINWNAPGLNWRFRSALVVLGCLFVTYAAWYIGYRFVGEPGGGSLTDLPQKLLHIFNRYENPMQLRLLIIYLLTNISFLGLFGLFAGWRAVSVMLTALLPNVVVTVGGAEHTGWTTHYHSMYLPFLVYCASIGFIRLRDNTWVAPRRYALRLVCLLPVLFGLIYNPYRGNFHPPSMVNFDTGIIRAVWNFYIHPSTSTDILIMQQAAEFDAAIPKGVKVTTPEGLMPSIYRNRTIYYYPIGIDTADYAVVFLSSGEGEQPYYAGAISYQGQAKQLDKCLNERLLKAGYNLDRPFRQLGNVIILKRESV